jgi:hypothetical protein
MGPETGMAIASSAIDPSRDHLSPDELAAASVYERLAAYSEDWVTAPRRAHSGERLGPDTQKRVLALLERGIDEAKIRDTALEALAIEEARILGQHRLRGWAVFGFCVALGIIAAVTWDGRGDGHGLYQVLLLGAIGLMLAHGIHMQGIRRRARLIRSTTARKQVWRAAIERLSAG